MPRRRSAEQPSVDIQPTAAAPTIAPPPRTRLGLLLRFSEPELEKEYLQAFHQEAIKRDLALILVSILPPLTAAHKLLQSNESFLWLIIECILPAIMLYMLKKHPEYYLKHRSMIILLNRYIKLIAYLPAIYRHEDTLTQVTMSGRAFANLQSTVFKSCLLAAFALWLRLPVYLVAPMNITALLATNYTTARKCVKECAVRELSARHAAWGSKLVRIAGILFPFPAVWKGPVAELSPQAGCWLTATFFQLMLGTLLPLLSLAAEEEHSRLEFLALNEAGSAYIPSYIQIVLHSVCLFFVAGPILLQLLALMAVYLVK